MLNNLMVMGFNGDLMGKMMISWGVNGDLMI
jgi:hypothetical protein